MQRFFVNPQSMEADENALPEEVLHHLTTVLRRSEGEEFLLLDGTGNICRCRLATLTRRTGTARVLERWREEETAFPITLLQALPKGDKFELVLQKGTELGITGFVPVQAGRSIPTPGAGREMARRRRWERIIQEAARQCRRPVLPLISPLLPLADALADCRPRLRLLLWEEESRPLADLLPSVPPLDAAVLVGPEGGWSPAEVTEARDAGFLPVSLGPRILRTETAGLAVATILQHRYGDLGSLPRSSTSPITQP